MKSFSLIFILLLPILAHTQTNFNSLKLGFSSFSAGYTSMMPSFHPEVNTDRWQGVHMRGRIFEFMFTQGAMQYQEEGHPDFQSGKGSMTHLGINIPLHRLSLIRRKTYIGGIHLAPIVGIHYSIASVMRPGISQHGINLSPGINLQLPFVVLDARLNTAMYFGRKEEVSPYRGNVLLTPSLSLQFDGLFEVLGGRAAESGTFDYTYQVLEDIETSYNADRTIKTETHTYQKFAGHTRTFMTIQRAFWYIKPSFGVGLTAMPYEVSEAYQAGNVKSISLGGRWMYFMGDLGLEHGKGYFASRDPQYIEELQPFADSYPSTLSGKFNGLELRGKAGLDFIALVQGIIMPRSMQGAKSFGYKWTKFIRWQGGVSGGFLFPGQLQFEDSEASELLDSYFAAHPALPSTRRTDIRKTGPGATFGLFTHVEFGAASFEFDWHGNHHLGWHSSFRIGYLIPLQEIGRYLNR
ncbi:MAG: hypothetical protein AAF587_28540 [Bacteroidota bacterium]